MKVDSMKGTRAGTKGQQLVDFTVAFGFLVLFIILPLIDLGIVPIRYALASSTISDYTRKLSLAESGSQAFGMAEKADSELTSMLSRLGGVTVKSTKVSVLVDSQKSPGTNTVVEKAKSVPPEWLPNGPNCPCQYMLKLTVVTDLDPMIKIAYGGHKIPGLNAPFTLTITSSAPWENLGRNPQSGEFFLNE